MKQSRYIFRGLTPQGKWVYGDLIKNPTINDAKIGSWDDTTVGSAYRHYEVLPETVGQWTGLHDAEGKKIWEGDVVEFVIETFGDPREIPEQQIGAVIFEDAGFWARGNRGKFQLSLGTISLKVIGNIHQPVIEAS